MSTPEDESNDSEDPYNKPIYFFGKDVRTVKCFRNSILFGVSAGIGTAIGAFMWTSKAKFSINVGLFSIWPSVFLYWIPCRYKYETSVLQIEGFKERMKQRMEETNNMKEKNIMKENAS